MAEFLSFDELVSEPDTQYEEVKFGRGTVRIGSVSSKEILQWFDDNEDKVRGQYSGLRLAIKSIVNPDGKRIGEGLPDAERQEAQEAALLKLLARNARDNGRLVAACLVLNGVRPKGKSPNVSSEAPSTDASPSESPSQPAA